MATRRAGATRPVLHMHDLLRANGIKHYAGRPLKDGQEFVADAKFTPVLVMMGLATIVQRDVTAPTDGPRPPRKTKRRYRTRDLTAEN